VVDERTALTNRLQALLKSYFPQALELCGEDLWRPLALGFLRRWPSLQALRKARPETLRSFYYLHGSRSQKLIAQRLELIEKAVPLSEASALIESFTLRVRLVVRQLQALGPVVAEYDRQIAEVFAAHPDAPIFKSLPGAGPVLAPRLLAAMGSQRVAMCQRHRTGHPPERWKAIGQTSLHRSALRAPGLSRMGPGKRPPQLVGGRLLRATARQGLPAPHRGARSGLQVAAHHLALLAGSQTLLRRNLSGRTHSQQKSPR
jgi:hypothetical protein